MCTPVGHALGGIAASGAFPGWRPLAGRWRSLIFIMLVAQAPDLDFIPGLLMGKADVYHHGISHSLGMAILVGLLCALWRRRKGKALLWGLAGFSLVFSHVLLDALTTDTRPPFGVPLWWPISDEYIQFYPLFPDVWRYPPWLATLVHNLWAVAVEVVLLGPLAVIALWVRRRKRALAEAPA